MEQNNQNLSKKELYDLKRGEKNKDIKKPMSKTARRTILWVVVLLVIGGAIWGIVKLASSQNPGSGINITTGSIAPVTDSDWVKGNKDAKVTLIEYSDFQCPACGIYFQILKPLDKDLGDKVRFVYRNFPLSQHANAKVAASAAAAAAKQGKLWEMHDLIFENQDKWSNLSNAEAKNTFAQYAQSLKLNIDTFRKDMDAKDVADKINNDSQSGITAGVNSTPTFYLNGKRIQPNSYDEFKSLINQALNS
jgi:protein-disulfide isomerase